jgi:hypothetical protein
MEIDDIYQEMTITLLKCWNNWTPGKLGKNGKPSSFFNYALTAMENTSGKLRHKSRQFYQSVDQYVCANEECGMVMTPRGRCEGCGGGRRKEVRGNIVANTDFHLNQPAQFSFDDEEAGIADLVEALGYTGADVVSDEVAEYLLGTRERLSVKARAKLREVYTCNNSQSLLVN